MHVPMMTHFLTVPVETKFLNGMNSAVLKIAVRYQIISDPFPEVSDPIWFPPDILSDPFLSTCIQISDPSFSSDIICSTCSPVFFLIFQMHNGLSKNIWISIHFNDLFTDLVDQKHQPEKEVSLATKYLSVSSWQLLFVLINLFCNKSFTNYFLYI